MRHLILLTFVLALGLSCKKKQEPLTAQQIVDKAIAVSGGALHDQKLVSFTFRDRAYSAYRENGKKIYTRKQEADTLLIEDIKSNSDFQRFVNGSLVQVSDSMAQRYLNSVNSVHYFARLPFGLNDPAVHKELLGEETIKNKNYYKIKVNFDQEDGGVDFEDTYLYWFDKETFKPDYLAYSFHVNDGGIRFREAYNERYVNGIRFVDYNNFKADQATIDFMQVGQYFESEELELLSKIELVDLSVRPLP